MTEGRFESAGWRLSRAVITALCEEDGQPVPAGMGYVMLAVSVGWGLASPVVYGGRLLDRLAATLRGTHPDVTADEIGGFVIDQ